MDNKEKEDKKNSGNQKEELIKMIDYYLVNPNFREDHKINEVEVRFGIFDDRKYMDLPRHKTGPMSAKPITKINYDNVVKQLYSAGFTLKEDKHLLRINTSRRHNNGNDLITTDTRAEIDGLSYIKKYCEKNDLKNLATDTPFSSKSRNVKFTTKSLPAYPDGTLIKPIKMEDYSYRISYKLEQDFSLKTDKSKKIVADWADLKKTFRYMNRVRFSHPTLPIVADMSIIKTNKKSGLTPIPTYTIQEANVFQNEENYEIELEIDNNRVGKGTTDYDTTEKVLVALRKMIHVVLVAIQGTNSPVSYVEQDRVLVSYMKMIYASRKRDDKDTDPNTEYNINKRDVKGSDFIGPSSTTLQMENLYETSRINILDNYCATEKADGERKLLYIHPNGRFYLIDTNMNIQYTGISTKNEKLLNTIIDGEHIKQDKNSKYINLFMAFDIYFIQSKSCREFSFMDCSPISAEEKTQLNRPNYRLELLQKRIQLLNTSMILTQTKDACSLKIGCKEFYSTKNQTIFSACKTVLEKRQFYLYETDGVILTPCNKPVDVRIPTVDFPDPPFKITWKESFKWKPANYNTIDFLVRVQKNKKGQDEIHTVFEKGTDLSSVDVVKQYKTLILCCGFSKNDRFANPYMTMLSLLKDDVKERRENYSDSYKPVPFQPTEPFDPTAYLCNIFLQPDDFGELVLKTESAEDSVNLLEDPSNGGEFFEEDMIVEFKYDLEVEDPLWRWKPIRVRNDKTAELRSGQKNYGNGYNVANSNWSSIHHPITDDIITGMASVPPMEENDDVYYNKSASTVKSDYTRGLRDFHNLYVKRRLIQSVSQRGDTLIDYAVGKAGDLAKWTFAQLSFIFGVDISRDNINNMADGACVRYIKDKQRHRTPEYHALFVVGDSSLNIRSGEAISTPKEKKLVKGLFGDDLTLGKDSDLGKFNGLGTLGFQISSCQFALHYFFKTKATFHGFLCNLAECTKKGGYFIGTCYDGERVFNLLQKYKKGDGIIYTRQRGQELNNDTKKIFEIKKLYDETGFPDDENSLHYEISVYQESINKYFSEFLVNFRFFQRMMENYGFVLVDVSKDRRITLPKATGFFDELFNEMTEEIKRNPAVEYGSAKTMNPADEQKISFLNRYFVFQKVREVDTKTIVKIIERKERMVEDVKEELLENEDDILQIGLKTTTGDKGTETIEKKAEPTRVLKKANIRKITGTTQKKVVLDKYSPIVESPSSGEE